jgi:hypothetical protein
MEINIGSKKILAGLQILTWVIFIGLCVEAGGIIFNTCFVFFFNEEAVHQFWMNIDLSALFLYDKGQFLAIAIFMVIVAVLKAFMFYLILKLFLNKSFDFSNPFNAILEKLISLLAYVALGIGLFSSWGLKYAEWLNTKALLIPSIHHLKLGGADVWLFTAVIFLVIAQIFKRGIEIQTENDLTV